MMKAIEEYGRLSFGVTPYVLIEAKVIIDVFSAKAIVRHGDVRRRHARAGDETANDTRSETLSRRF